MKVLFLTRFFPDDPATQTHGVFGRLRTLIRSAAAAGADVHLLFFTEQHAVISSQMEAWSSRLCNYYGVSVSFNVVPVESHQSKVRNSYAGILAGALTWLKQDGYYRMAGEGQLAAFERALPGVDLIFVHRLVCMPPVLACQKALPRVFLDMDDIEHVALGRAIAQPPHWFSKRLGRLHLPALRHAEVRAVRKSDMTFVCSESDVALLKESTACEKVDELPNSVRIAELTPLPDAPAFLFLGTYAYAPNVVAVEWLLDLVWPIIRAKIPDAVLTVAGGHAENIRHYAEPPEGVSFPGFVPDLDGLYATARVVVCPIRNGGGTRVKLIESAAYGRPAVATTVGAEGLSFQPEREILIADDPAHFAEQCIRLLKDGELANAISVASHRRARDQYDHEAIVSQLGSKIRMAIEGGAR